MVGTEMKTEDTGMVSSVVRSCSVAGCLRRVLGLVTGRAAMELRAVGLHVEKEMHHVAILHDVFLAFDAEHARRAAG